MTLVRFLAKSVPNVVGGSRWKITTRTATPLMDICGNARHALAHMLSIIVRQTERSYWLAKLLTIKHIGKRESPNRLLIGKPIQTKCGNPRSVTAKRMLRSVPPDRRRGETPIMIES